MPDSTAARPTYIVDENGIPHCTDPKPHRHSSLEAPLVCDLAAATCPECGGHSDLPHDDIRAIMLALDISDHARPYSTHAVVHREILPAIRRLRGI
jgi:hypothetical protein